MSNAYSQIHIHFIFAVKYRAALIDPKWCDQLHRYITAITQGQGHKMMQINSMPDHIHMLTGHRPSQSLSSFIQIVKSESTKWVNDSKFCRGSFSWQEGYGAFSYAKSDVPAVIGYIIKQQEHHKKETFLTEYKRMLDELEVEYQSQYLFTEPV